MTKAPRGYWLVAACYQAFTLSDGALRMLVLLHLGAAGRAPLALALILVPYEAAGVVTNLLGGWLGARFGLKAPLVIGLALQAIACAMLAADPAALTVAWLAASQCLSGVAKDLAKTSAKSFVRQLAPDDAAEGPLYRLVAWLTGSKNAVKGLGFFVGGALLALAGFRATNVALAALLAAAAALAALRLPPAPGRANARIGDVVQQPAAIRWLAVSRALLFGARDVWFAVALPLFLGARGGLPAAAVGAFLAAWVIAYGAVQASAPRLCPAVDVPTGARRAAAVALASAGPLGALALAMPAAWFAAAPAAVLGVGLAGFGALFAIVSSLHSWLAVAIAGPGDAVERVGFYYAANSVGRLGGLLASGWIYGLATSPESGLQQCLLAAVGLTVVGAATLLPIRRVA
jgi:hypothetical protein